MMKIKNKYITVFIYTLSTLVFFLPQLSTFYYVVFLDAFNLTNAQAGTLLSVYGMTSQMCIRDRILSVRPLLPD